MEWNNQDLCVTDIYIDGDTLLAELYECKKSVYMSPTPFTYSCFFCNGCSGSKPPMAGLTRVI